MSRLRIVLGFLVAVFLIVSSFMHSILGWRSLLGRLRETRAPEELIDLLALAWHMCSGAMFTFGCVLIVLFAKYVKDRSTSLVVAQLIAVMFIVPGILLLIAASSGAKKVAIAA
jgi:hypothetical protein